MEFEVITTEAGDVPDTATQYMVRMRDGVHLATDVYLPDGGEPTETVLVRICYDKNGRYTFMDLLAPYVTRRGYAFVVQDVRGKFRSEGVTMAFVPNGVTPNAPSQKTVNSMVLAATTTVTTTTTPVTTTTVGTTTTTTASTTTTKPKG